MIKCSVVIPSYNRLSLTQRAVDSVINCDPSGIVEIVVVDDCSIDDYSNLSLRPCDRYIRMNDNSGAAHCRNIGIQEAKGSVIYLLDSDDYFVHRDFESDYATVMSDPDSIHYCDVKKKFGSTNYPKEISPADYFRYILNDFEGVANTCTLVFTARAGYRFTSGLPRHQDWDFVYRNAIQSDRSLKKIPGLVYIDRSDKTSVSRIAKPERSYPWLSSIEPRIDKDLLLIVRFHILSHYTSEYDWRAFFAQGIRMCFAGNISWLKFFKRLIQRFNS